MSRLGNQPVVLPAKVDVTQEDGSVCVKGEKGQLSQYIDPQIECTIVDGQLTVKRKNDSKQARSLHGLYRQLIYNMVQGVSKGWEIKLEISGVGYRAELRAGNVILSLGFSMQIEYFLPAGVECVLESPTKLTLKSIDKQKVGQVASEIRGLRPPEPYKGKGVRYAGERVVIKAGKSGA